MSTYKVSYKLLAQQADDLTKLGTKLGTLAETLNAIPAKMGQGEMLEKAKADIQALASQMGSQGELLSIAGATLSEVVEDYSGVETKMVQQTETTRAHNRDFYKNPVAVSSGSGPSTAVDVTPINSVDASSSYSYTPAESTGAYDTSATSADTSGSSVNSMPDSVKSTQSAASSSGIGAAAAGVAGAAVGAGAIVGAKAVMDKMNKNKKEKNGDSSKLDYSMKNENTSENITAQQNSNINSGSDYEVEAKLALAKAKLNKLNEEQQEL